MNLTLEAEGAAITTAMAPILAASMVAFSLLVAPSLAAAAGAVAATIAPMLEATVGGCGGGAKSGKHSVQKKNPPREVQTCKIFIETKSTTTKLRRMAGSDKIIKHRRYLHIFVFVPDIQYPLG